MRTRLHADTALVILAGIGVGTCIARLITAQDGPLILDAFLYGLIGAMAFLDLRKIRKGDLKL